jgi:hypothetical protein
MNLRQLRQEFSSLPYNELTRHHYQVIAHGKLNSQQKEEHREHRARVRANVKY